MSDKITPSRKKITNKCTHTEWTAIYFKIFKHRNKLSDTHNVSNNVVLSDAHNVSNNVGLPDTHSASNNIGLSDM